MADAHVGMPPRSLPPMRRIKGGVAIWTSGSRFPLMPVRGRDRRPEAQPTCYPEKRLMNMRAGPRAVR
jgi:hypothetical protein